MGAIYKVIIPLISIAALIVSIYSWYLEDQRKLQINQVVELSKNINNRYLEPTSNIDSLRNEIIQLQFEKQSYISNLDLMSNWFIMFETILFGIFFVVGYGIFDNKIKDSYEKSKAAQKHINERYVYHEKELKSLKYDLDINMSNLIYIVGERGLSLFKYGEYLPNCISSINRLRKCYEYSKLKSELDLIDSRVIHLYGILLIINSQNIKLYKTENDNTYLVLRPPRKSDMITKKFL